MVVVGVGTRECRELVENFNVGKCYATSVLVMPNPPPSSPYLLLHTGNHHGLESSCPAAKFLVRLPSHPGRPTWCPPIARPLSTWPRFAARIQHSAAQTVDGAPSSCLQQSLDGIRMQPNVMWPLFVGQNARRPTATCSTPLRCPTVVTNVGPPLTGSSESHIVHVSRIADWMLSKWNYSTRRPLDPLAPQTHETIPSDSTDVAAVAQHLDHNVCQCAGSPERHQAPANHPVHFPPPPRHCQQ